MITLHVRQGCLRLAQPEGHVHSAVQGNGSREFGASRLPLTRLRIQHSETAVAVRLERPHAEFVGQGEGLAVVAGSWLDLWRCLARRALAQEPQGPGLVAALLVLAGEIESLPGALTCVFQATSQQIR